MRDSLDVRFWKRVDRSPSGCWLWKGGLFSEGRYGCFWMPSLGRMAGAHRAAWEITNGAIPEGLHVLHRCDNTHCVRPSHLFIGTHVDNMQDMAAKGRAAAMVHPDLVCRGERHGNSKLRPDDVRKIRSSLGSSDEISAAFGIHRNTVNKIRRRASWAHIE